jgi:ubiquilin
MGPPPDSEQLLELMENPMFLSQMNEAMDNPAVIEMMTQNPMVSLYIPFCLNIADSSVPE